MADAGPPEVIVAAFDSDFLLPARALTLTAGAVTLRTASDWHQVFADPEVAASLHRWNWLLYGITSDQFELSRDDGIAFMRSWIATCGDDSRYAGVPYTTGERLANGLLFLVRNSASIPEDLAEAFRSMAREIADAIEYRPEGQTGNHAFNNARALLLAGVLVDLTGARDLAYAIAAERLPVLVTSDGFMREGSSHYHFLFTRWVLEMLWVARRAGDVAFVDLLLRFAPGLVERSWFFLVRRQDAAWHIPLIGDVSPDFPPSWLVSLPWSALAAEAFTPDATPAAPCERGWASMFESLTSPAATTSAPEKGVVCFREGGWCRADMGVWTLFVRARSHDGVLRSGHEHADLGSYALFRDGEALIVDCGRHDYTDTPLGRYGQRAGAHNAPIINGLGAMVLGPSWLSARYTAVNVTLTAVATPTGCRVSIDHSGFRRIAGRRLSHRRELMLKADGLTVTDFLDGTGSCEVEIPLHFGPAVTCVESGRTWQLPTSRGQLRIDRALTVATAGDSLDCPEGGLYFPAYGQSQRICTLKATARVTLPVALSHALHDERSQACVA
jgi:Heparinase II/III-like protein/Heparinase II/III N-terminus